ncbi:DUF2145 domain-containing protein [Jannaschia seohaensis]|uniref:DUF2145 domain-containing protein n=1 Tax=Jannaschia seohaensis TaxID=475081 RepID=A0A2Y9B6X0_9RHOB|nr:DUF2145 domain-containing protein [Jannaschia seohaensis]PWJ12919.1 hypothetical protein BCF38_11555 [Jannaschia seohaensis]SSA50727.1 hypothetical protein SAMN05421539_11555 [Jannaschia seohaensis]
MARLVATLLMALALIAAALLPARAGSSEAGAPVLPAAQVAAFADQVQHDLAARGARVAIVARTGRDPSQLPEGIRYTHVAFWVYSAITTADGGEGRGYRVYNLYQRADELTVSDLVQDSPADFLAGAHRLDVGVIVPDPRLQERLLRTIAGPAYAGLHNPRYAVLANPSDARFQNCTEHTLHVLMAALYDTDDPARIRANVAAHFTPQPVRLGGAKRLLAPLASGALTTADHRGEVATATFGSIARFMQAHDLEDGVWRLTPQGAARF